MVDLLKKRFSHPLVLSAFLVAFFLYSGFIPLRKEKPYFSLLPKEGLVEVKGSISSNPVKSSKGKWYFLNVSLKEASGKLKDCKTTFIQSQAKGNISLLVPADFVESLYPGKLYSRSAESCLLETGESFIFQGSYSPKADAFIANKIIPLKAEKNFLYKISHFRSWCRLIFKRLMFRWGNAGGLILSLLSGSREYLEQNTADAFRRAGLSHVLALSGMHLSFFSSLTGRIGKKIGGKKMQTLLMVFGILAFVWFAGNSPSLFRALLCSLLMYFSRLLFLKETDLFIVLSASFLLHACIYPSHVTSPAFMLSYCALGGILLFSDFLTGLVTCLLPKKISDSFSASLAAQSATSPVSACLFKTLTPIGVFSSVVISPLISIFMTLALISITLSLFMPFLSDLFGAIMNLLYKVIASCVMFFSKAEPISFQETL